MPSAPADAVRETLRSLRIDRVSAEAVSALRAAGIPSVLLKGPAMVHRLYGDGAPRPYLDSDLLVAPERFAAAELVLMARGFVRGADEEHELPEWARHGHELIRARDGICVELHWTLMHYGVGPELVWNAFSREPRQLRVGGVEVDVPGDPQLALHTAVHVAEHGLIFPPAEDLRRALAQLPYETWVAARGLAAELGAIAAFSAGLMMVEQGREVAARLGVDAGGITAFSLDRIARARTPTEKARVALRIAFPDAHSMRSFGSPLASRGRIGLAAAYAWRPFELSVRAPRALVAQRRARADAR